MRDRSRESVDAARHLPAYDSEHIGRAVEKVNSDPNFIDYAVGQLAGLQFLAFKHTIVGHAKSINAGEDVIALFESLNGYMEFRDQHHVHKALQENVASKKKEMQISDGTREGPDVWTRPATADASIKEREAVNESEERKDHPEVTPTAMSNFVCDRCGKQFQNQQDLAQRRQFESGSAVT